MGMDDGVGNKQDLVPSYMTICESSLVLEYLLPAKRLLGLRGSFWKDACMPSTNGTTISCYLRKPCSTASITNSNRMTLLLRAILQNTCSILSSDGTDLEVPFVSDPPIEAITLPWSPLRP